MRGIKNLFWGTFLVCLVLVGSSLTAMAAPNAPTLSGSLSKPCTVSLSWSKVAGVDGYKVYVNGSYLITRGSENATSYKYTELVSTNRSFYVKAYIGGTMSPASNTVTVKLGVAAPTLSGSLSGTTANLSWNSIPGVTGYRVYRSDKSNYDVVSGTSYTDSGLTPGTSYSYYVKAYFDERVIGYGEWFAISQASNTVTLTPTPMTVKVSSISITPSPASMQVGSTTTLTVNVSPSNATNKSVAWGSSNPSIAKVNLTMGGAIQVTGVSAGTATVTATAMDGSGKSGSCTVTVSAPTVKVSSVSISPSSTSINVGSSTTLTANVFPSNATNKSVAWGSSNPSIARVSSTTGQSIQITGVSAGTATIRATAMDGSGASGTCTVTVSSPPPPVTLSSISVSPSSASITGTSTYYGALSVTAYYSNGSSTNVTGSTSFSSSNSSIAYTSGSSLYSGSTTGSATITAQYSGKYAYCNVTVSPAATLSSISVSPSSASITGANKLYGALTVTAYYTNGTSATVTGPTTFSSSNSSVAYMSGSNLYSGSSTGSATITASYSGRTATCSVTVTPADTTPPTISTTSPSSGAANFGIASSITVTFSEAVQAGSASTTLKDGTGTAVPFAATISGAVLTIKPNASLLNNTIYTVSIPANAVKDAAGNNYNPTPNPYTFSFTTAPAPSSGGSDVFIVPVNTTFTIYMMGEFQGTDTWTIPGDSNTYTNKVTVTSMTGQGYTTITGSFNGQGPKFGSIGPTNVKVNFFVVAAPNPNSSAKVKFSN